MISSDDGNDDNQSNKEATRVATASVASPGRFSEYRVSTTCARHLLFYVCHRSNHMEKAMKDNLNITMTTKGGLSSTILITKVTKARRKKPIR